MTLLRTVVGWWLLVCVAGAQDAATGALAGTVTDPSGARIAAAVVTVRDAAGEQRNTVTNDMGAFRFDLLASGVYGCTVSAKGFAVRESKVTVELGASAVIEMKLAVRANETTVQVTESLVDGTASALTNNVDKKAIEDVPLNGRRFTDLALLTPNVTTDPRGLTSASNGDLAVGGIRGFQTQYLVDGSDNNNAFFGQARGRYRAPYQFSNEVIQEFRVSTADYSAEQGRTSSAVVNVVTRSGSNEVHGKVFYFFRGDEFNARHPYVDFKPHEQQHQLGLTLGGPIRKDRIHYFFGFDQHIFHVPNVVEFANGSTVLTPATTDYEVTDQAQVFASAAQLSQLGGAFRSSLLGNSAFAKLDWVANEKNHLSIRANTSRYYGDNNVFFDPASPVTNFAESSNGLEEVSTESIGGNLLTRFTPRLTSHLRVQFSRDLQLSSGNSTAILTKITNELNGIGRSNILPRRTREFRIHAAETMAWTHGRHELKFGGDFTPVWIDNYFPSEFGGEFIFDRISVNPFSFVPQPVGGLRITPLRAYAHGVPRYYVQNFGKATSHPDSNEFSLFVQDSIRATQHLTLNLGLRYDVQSMHADDLITNPLWADAGKLPLDLNNFAPRLGVAYAIGKSNPLVLRAGYGVFYSRVPQIYESAVERENGIDNQHLFLDNQNFYDHLVFPAYGTAIASCPPGAQQCLAPASIATMVDPSGPDLKSDISAFAHNFQMPRSEHAHGSVEKELPGGIVMNVSYLYVHGEGLIRARDYNLPKPTRVQFPVFDESGSTFTGSYYTVDSFATVQNTPTLGCPFPPCINDVARPIASLASIKVFENAATSVYHGGTFTLSKRMARGWYFRVAHTWANAEDDLQDALVAGRPVLVQNAYIPKAERGRSSTDQRHRFIAAWVWEPKRHGAATRRQSFLADWRFSGLMTAGSGRPFNAKVVGDANGDDSPDNDRLPGAARNSLLGPGYFTTDLRLSKTIHLADRWRMELLAESFNVFNRDNRRLDLSDDGFLNTAATFDFSRKTVGVQKFPAHFHSQKNFLKPPNAYAPRQVQFGLRLDF